MTRWLLNRYTVRASQGLRKGVENVFNKPFQL